MFGVLSLLKALFYASRHPFEPVHFTVVRRYVDAQGHHVGELYEGEGRSARMIGMSCDNLPLETGSAGSAVLTWGESFLEPMTRPIIRVGSDVPSNNKSVHEFVALRRFCPIRITVLNRFVEYILQGKTV